MNHRGAHINITEEGAVVGTNCIESSTQSRDLHFDGLKVSKSSSNSNCNSFDSDDYESCNGVDEKNDL